MTVRKEILDKKYQLSCQNFYPLAEMSLLTIWTKTQVRSQNPPACLHRFGLTQQFLPANFLNDGSFVKSFSREKLKIGLCQTRQCTPPPHAILNLFTLIIRQMRISPSPDCIVQLYLLLCSVMHFLQTPASVFCLVGYSHCESFSKVQQKQNKLNYNQKMTTFGRVVINA